MLFLVFRSLIMMYSGMYFFRFVLFFNQQLESIGLCLLKILKFLASIYFTAHSFSVVRTLMVQMLNLLL